MEEEGARVGRLSSPLPPGSPLSYPHAKPTWAPCAKSESSVARLLQRRPDVATTTLAPSSPSWARCWAGSREGGSRSHPPRSPRAWGKPCREGALLLTWHWGGQEALQLQKKICNLMLGRSTAALPHIWFSAKLPQLNNHLSESAAALEFYSGEGEMEISLL